MRGSSLAVAVAALLLAFVAEAAPSRDVSGEWSEVVPVVLIFAGIGASLCVALGALVRRLGRLMQSTEGSH